jgi:hypothetical protein
MASDQRRLLVAGEVTAWRGRRAVGCSGGCNGGWVQSWVRLGSPSTARSEHPSVRDLWAAGQDRTATQGSRSGAHVGLGRMGRAAVSVYKNALHDCIDCGIDGCIASERCASVSWPAMELEGLSSEHRPAYSGCVEQMLATLSMLTTMLTTVQCPRQRSAHDSALPTTGLVRDPCRAGPQPCPQCNEQVGGERAQALPCV